VVAAASYEARNWCKSAMSGFIAKKNCPDLFFVSPRFDRYKEISNKNSVF
jgi:DNA polymerase-4